MENLVLAVKQRAETGSNASNRVRKQGGIPVNFYGPSGNRLLTVNDSEFRVFYKKVRGQTALFEIEDESGKRVRSLIEEVQIDPISQKVIHVDIREIAKGVEISAHVVVHTKGQAYGVKNEGGVIEIVAHQVDVRCLPRHLPTEILVDVTNLKLHDSIHIGELPVLEGVTYLGDPGQVVVSCSGTATSASVEDSEEESE
jgi:large subunit ribosomal protein L25